MKSTNNEGQLYLHFCVIVSAAATWSQMKYYTESQNIRPMRVELAEAGALLSSACSSPPVPLSPSQKHHGTTQRRAEAGKHVGWGDITAGGGQGPTSPQLSTKDIG